MQHYRGVRGQRGFWNVVIPAAIGAIGSIAGGALSSSGAKSANKGNVKIAREQMDFQERMSNTAYQRATSDMEKAGLNPMLAYSQGGSSTPSGASTTLENPRLGIGQGVASSAQQAMTIAGAMTQLDQTRSQTANVDAQTRKIESETMTNDLNARALIAQMERNIAEGKFTGARTETEAFRKILEDYNSLTAKRVFEEMNGEGPGDRSSGFRTDVERRKVALQHERFGLSEAKSTSEYFNKMGDMPKFIQLILQMFNSLSRR